jgi:alkylation response protein AidB-like acyl-CoA dehydrogenase
VAIDLAYHAQARELADAVRRRCERSAAQEADASGMSVELWAELAAMGVLGLTRPDQGDAEVLAAALIELGRGGVRGPLLGVLLAVRLLPDDLAEQIADGRAIPSVGSPPLMPWAPVADAFVELAGSTAYVAHPVGEIEAVDTLAGEPWGRCTLERERELDAVADAAVLAEVGIAAYLVGAGQHLLDTAVTYAGQRTQFGRPIGDFQATAHPLATSRLQLGAAEVLVRLAAHAVDTADPARAAGAAAALRSAGTAAIDTAYRAHQTLGAMGFTVEGPIGRHSRLIRQTVAAATVLGDLTTDVLAPYGL